LKSEQNIPPLKGIKVLDLSRLLPGPLCSLFLADLGAEVIKIEDPILGDFSRKFPPIKDKNSWSYLLINRNKKVKYFNLKDDNDRKNFLELTKDVDVLLEGFRPGVTKRLGVDYEAICKINPKIVYCSLTAFGQTGPLKDKAAHDINILGLSGLLDQMKRKGEPPTWGNIQWADTAGGGLHACIGILAALFGSKIHGIGRYVDISMLDGLISLSPFLFAGLQANGKLASRSQDFLSGAAPFYRVYETNDQKFMALGAIEKKFWIEFCKGIEREDLIELHDSRLYSDESLHQAIEKAIRKCTQSEWVAKFEAIDACFTPVLPMDETILHPQVLERSMVIESIHPTDGEFKQFALPIKMSDFKFMEYLPAP